MKDAVRDAICIAVHDGDTVTLSIVYPFLGLDTERNIKDEKVRLSGIQAAELKGLLPEKAAAARDFLTSQILNQRVTVQKTSTDKYGPRIDALIWLGEISINDLMISSGHAVAWDGKGPKPLG